MIAAYDGSKHAVIGITKSAACEHAKDRINVNAICPGIVNTSMTLECEYRRVRSGCEAPRASANAFLCRHQGSRGRCPLQGQDSLATRRTSRRPVCLFFHTASM